MEKERDRFFLSSIPIKTRPQAKTAKTTPLAPENIELAKFPKLSTDQPKPKPNQVPLWLLVYELNQFDS